MSADTFWLGRAAGVAVLLALGSLLWWWFGDRQSPGSARLLGYHAWLQAKLRCLRSPLTPSAVLAAQAVLGIGSAAGAVASRELLPLLPLPVVLFGPAGVLQRLVARRVSRIEEQVEPWLMAIANALKGSPALGDAIGSTLALKYHRHIKLEILLRFCTERIRFIANIAASAFGMGVMGILAWASLEFVKNEVGIFGPWGWVSVIFPIFFSVSFFRYFVRIVGR